MVKRLIAATCLAGLLSPITAAQSNPSIESTLTYLLKVLHNHTEFHEVVSNLSHSLEVESYNSFPQSQANVACYASSYSKVLDEYKDFITFNDVHKFYSHGCKSSPLNTAYKSFLKEQSNHLSAGANNLTIYDDFHNLHALVQKLDVHQARNIVENDTEMTLALSLTRKAILSDFASRLYASSQALKTKTIINLMKILAKDDIEAFYNSYYLHASPLSTEASAAFASVGRILQTYQELVDTKDTPLLFSFSLFDFEAPNLLDADILIKSLRKKGSALLAPLLEWITENHEVITEAESNFFELLSFSPPLSTSPLSSHDSPLSSLPYTARIKFLRSIFAGRDLFASLTSLSSLSLSNPLSFPEVINQSVETALRQSLLVRNGQFFLAKDIVPFRAQCDKESSLYSPFSPFFDLCYHLDKFYANDRLVLPLSPHLSHSQTLFLSAMLEIEMGDDFSSSPISSLSSIHSIPLLSSKEFKDTKNIQQLVTLFEKNAQERHAVIAKSQRMTDRFNEFSSSLSVVSRAFSQEMERFTTPLLSPLLFANVAESTQLKQHTEARKNFANLRIANFFPSLIVDSEEKQQRDAIKAIWRRDTEVKFDKVFKEIFGEVVEGLSTSIVIGFLEDDIEAVKKELLSLSGAVGEVRGKSEEKAEGLKDWIVKRLRSKSVEGRTEEVAETEAERIANDKRMMKEEKRGEIRDMLRTVEKRIPLYMKWAERSLEECDAPIHAFHDYGRGLLSEAHKRRGDIEGERLLINDEMKKQALADRKLAEKEDEYNVIITTRDDYYKALGEAKSREKEREVRENSRTRETALLANLVKKLQVCDVMSPQEDVRAKFLLASLEKFYRSLLEDIKNSPLLS